MSLEVKHDDLRRSCDSILTMKAWARIINRIMLLYIGAGSDVRPITDLPYRHFLYVDALPNKPHYQPDQYGYPFYKDEASFVNTLETNLYDAECDVDFRVKLSSNVYRHSIDGHYKTLTYAINTLDEHAHEVLEVAALLPSVSAVFLAGYLQVFNGLLPSLETIYASSLGEEDLYDEWTERFCMGQEVKCVRIYDTYFSGCNVFDKIPTWSDDSDAEYSDSQDSQDSDSE
jgi:hypothetical protein